MKILLSGFVIGVANVIPGVSGGTMALMLGLYERILRVITDLSGRGVRDLIWIAVRPEATSRLERFRWWFREYDVFFCVQLGCGVVSAIFATSGLMRRLLIESHDGTYAFFFGVVAVSAIVPWRAIKKTKLWSIWLAVVIGFGIAAGMPALQSPDAKIASAQKKLELKSGEAQRNVGESVETSWSSLIFYVLAGGASVSAMVLPGVSGSFLLIVFGVYFNLLEAVLNFDIWILGSFVLGCLVGLALCVRVVTFMVKHFHDLTFAFLAGLMLGSLRVVWPFQSFQIVGDRRIDLNPVIPALGPEWFVPIATATFGGLCVLVFLYLEKRFHSQNRGI